jgi:putative type I restriction enzyme specificity protein HI_0216
MEKLLAGEKVEWKRLEDLINYEQPTKYIVSSTEYNDEFAIPVLTAGQTFILGYTNEMKGIYEANTENPVIIFDDFTTSNHWVDFKFKVKSSALKILKSKNMNVNLRYCYHYMKTIKLDITEHKRMWISRYSQIKIPLPSLETQEKIVKILDSYTEYITELQEKLKIELQARNKRYNYYRDMLLSEDYLNKISEKLDSLNVENQELRLTTLGEVGKVSMCRRILKNQTISNGEVPFYKIGTFGKKSDSFISKSLFEEYKLRYSFPKKGDILISASGTIGRTVIYNGEDAYFQDSNIVWINNDETVVKNKYLYYFYSTNPWKISNGGTISRIYNKDIEKIKIFVPPIEIQNKIVKILDRFQELLSDTKGLLPLEIEQRRKQYEYYREKLLTFDSICARTNERTLIFKQYLRLVNEAAKVAGIDISDKVEWKRLGEVANVNRGASPRPIKNYLTDDITGVPWIKIGDAKKESKYIENTSEKITREGSLKSRILKKGDLILSNSLSYGRAYILNINGAIHDGWASISEYHDKLNTEYLYYYLETSVVKGYWESKINGQSISNLNSDIIKEVNIPIPSLSVQQHIVSKLDKFDKIINDIKQGLPREIELRQKQYEYYREKLLNFEK